MAHVIIYPADKFNFGKKDSYFTQEIDLDETYYGQESWDHPYTSMPTENESTTFSYNFPYQKANKAIDCAMLAYILISIANQYSKVLSPKDPATLSNQAEHSNMFYGLLARLCPEFLHTIGQHGIFLIDCSVIIFKGFIYKTIAKLILLAAKTDVTGLIKRYKDNK